MVGGKIYSEELEELIDKAGKVSESDIKVPTDIQDHWAESVTIAASAARTASGNTGEIDVGRFDKGEICVDVTAVSGGTPTLDVFIEGRAEVSGKRKILASFTGITGVSIHWATLNPLIFREIRARWVIGGSSPSFTFSVELQGKS